MFLLLALLACTPGEPVPEPVPPDEVTSHAEPVLTPDPAPVAVVEVPTVETTEPTSTPTVAVSTPVPTKVQDPTHEPLPQGSGKPVGPEP